MTITIILPVFGCSPWMEQAILSVIEQDSTDWKLIIADDGLDKAGVEALKNLLLNHNNTNVSWIKNENNLGLFGNLNKFLRLMSDDWALLLCSDDVLKKNAVTTINDLRGKWPDEKLILSTFESINGDGSPRENASAVHHDELLQVTGLAEPRVMIPALLKLGSLNGNLTGMAFSKQFWVETGPFKEEWKHAADWEWLIRACENSKVLMNRVPIAKVRTHQGQLSNQNRCSGDEQKEVGEVVRKLLNHDLLSSIPERKAWAGHVMQHQLWNLLKASRQGDINKWSTGLVAIHKSAGISQTCWSLIKWLPERWKRKKKQN